MSRARIAAMAALVAFGAGCASQVGMGRATTLAKGGVRLGMALEGSVLSAQLTPTQPVPGPWAHMVLGTHVGVTDDVEVGGRLWGFALPGLFADIGGALDTKVQLRRSPPGNRGLDVAAALSLSYTHPTLGGAPWHVFGGTLPLLLGFNFGRHQLVLGPRVADFVVTGYGQNAINAFYFGASVGFHARFRETFDFSPEILWMYSPTSFGGEGSDDDLRVGVNALQLGIGGSWELGAKREAPAPTAAR